MPIRRHLQNLNLLGMFLDLFAELSAKGIPSQLVKSSDIFQLDALRVVLLEVVQGPLQPGHGVKVLLQRAVVAAHRTGSKSGLYLCNRKKNNT